MLAQATTLKEAIAVLEDGMKGTLADYTIDLGNGNPVDGCIPIRREQYSRREKSGEELIAEQKQQAEQRG